MEPANFSELRSKIDSWDISAEELLLQKMKIFTLNYNEEFQLFCKNMDNFSNSIETVEVEHLKAINQLKILSRDRFVENTIDNEESESETNENRINEGPREIQIANVEEIKSTIEISINCLNQINKKNKNQEEIEDDTVSVVSSKIMTVDNKAKVRLPFIIGTELFMADKAIGLNVAREKDEDEEVEKEKNEEEEEHDSDVEEFVKDIKVDKKLRKKWEKNEKRKRQKREKEREKKEEQKQSVMLQNMKSLKLKSQLKMRETI